jgi:calcineurin-like phosphoesterase family protein
MKFFTSDTHFGHKNIIKFCNRPYKDVPHMNEMLIENWNARVGPDDHVFHLGDVALGPWEDWDASLSRLNGHKHLIIGNHDRLFMETNQHKLQRWYAEYDKWFETATRAGSVTLSDGTLVYMSHFPYTGDHFDADRFESERLSDDGTILLHGHTHSNSWWSTSSLGTPQIHVGVDAHDYAPVSEDEVIALIKTGTLQ